MPIFSRRIGDARPFRPAPPRRITCREPRAGPLFVPPAHVNASPTFLACQRVPRRNALPAKTHRCSRLIPGDVILRAIAADISAQPRKQGAVAKSGRFQHLSRSAPRPSRARNRAATCAPVGVWSAALPARLNEMFAAQGIKTVSSPNARPAISRRRSSQS